MIGIDNMTGHFRYSFDLAEFGDGIGIVPVAVGLFGLGEILSTPSTGAVKDIISPRSASYCRRASEWKRRQDADRAWHRAWLHYRHHSRFGPCDFELLVLRYRTPHLEAPEQFGKGAVAGVAGPETANNAASTGAFVPLLALGIPTSPITAVLIGALMIYGVSVGPMLVNEHPNVFWGFVASMYVGNSCCWCSTCRWSACS